MEAHPELAQVPTIATTTAAELGRQAADMLEVARAYTVDSAEMYALAGEELRTIATRRAQLEEKRLAITRPMDAAKRAVMDLFRQPLAVLDEAESCLRRAMIEWKRAEDARLEAERREAERRAEAERQRLEAERREAEEREREARAAAQAALAAGDQEAFAKAAKAAEAAAAQREEVEEAAELAEVAPPAAALVTAAPKAAGVATRQTWKAEVVSLADLVKGAAEALARGDDTLLAYLQPNTTALGQVARSLKDRTRIPGVRVYAEDTLAVRRR